MSTRRTEVVAQAKGQDGRPFGWGQPWVPVEDSGCPVHPWPLGRTRQPCPGEAQGIEGHGARSLLRLSPTHVPQLKSRVLMMITMETPKHFYEGTPGQLLWKWVTISVHKEGAKQMLFLSVAKRTDAPITFVTLCVYPK